jgi:hypothetical protein
MMNDPRQALESMANDQSIRKGLRDQAAALLNEITRRDEYLTVMARNGWFDVDCSAEYDRLYRLESTAWRLIEHA